MDYDLLNLYGVDTKASKCCAQFDYLSPLSQREYDLNNESHVICKDANADFMSDKDTFTVFSISSHNFDEHSLFCLNESLSKEFVKLNNCKSYNINKKGYAYE